MVGRYVSNDTMIIQMMGDSGNSISKAFIHCWGETVFLRSRVVGGVSGTSVLAHLWRPKKDVTLPTLLVPFQQVSHWSQSQAPYSSLLVSPPTELGLQVHPATPCFLCEQGLELRPSSLHGKRSYPLSNGVSQMGSRFSKIINLSPASRRNWPILKEKIGSLHE